MSKRDYQAIARAIHDVYVGNDSYFQGQPGGSDPVSRIKLAIADVLAQDNPRFDRARFIEACETGSCKGMPKRSAA